MFLNCRFLTISYSLLFGEVPEWLSRLWRDPSYGGNGAVSPKWSAYGGKTLGLLEIIGEVPEWLNGAVSKTVVP
jgi:hypothetical protein